MRGTRRRIQAALGAAALAALVPGPAWAHAFGTRYDLPLPLGFYLTGAGAAVMLSFVVMARFLRRRGDYGERHRFDLLGVPALGWLGSISSDRCRRPCSCCCSPPASSATRTR